MITTERQIHSTPKTSRKPKAFQKNRPSQTSQPLRSSRLATWIFLGIAGFLLALAFAWLTGNDAMEAIAAYLSGVQDNPPQWIQVPEGLTGAWLAAPTLLSAGVAWLVMKRTERETTWARTFILVLMIGVLMRYLLWRSLSTLNMVDPLSGIVSISLLAMELIVLSGTLIQFLLQLLVVERNTDADRFEQDVLSQRYQPTVDILVPTYNEPVEVLRRTLVGCQAIAYSPKTIYLLDDQRRPEMAELAQELGCEYMTRPDNMHAKSGNLNHALGHTNGELIVVFDADFVPTTNFMSRTIGFFQTSSVGLLQTHQSFYSHDPIARNLGMEDTLTHEVEIFSRHYQVLRDSLETALCYGSSFVVRRSALERIGGFVTNTLSEDYFTSVNLSAGGDRVLYLNERLSAGACADTMTDHVAQRLRWAQGTLQAFFISANPATIKGLTLAQRLAHLEGIIQWFGSVFRVVFLLMPVLYTFGGILPLRITAEEWWYFFLPFYVLQLMTFSWLNGHSRSALLSDIYSISLCFPVALRVCQTIIQPFNRGFRVTPKGQTRQGYTYNWSLAMPLLIVLGLILASLVQNLQYATMGRAELLAQFGDIDLARTMSLAWVWTLYNLLMLIFALRTFLDVPHPDSNPWFALQYRVRLGQSDGPQIEGVTRQLSESGVMIEVPRTAIAQPSLTSASLNGHPFESSQIDSFIDKNGEINVALIDEEVVLKGVITGIDVAATKATVNIQFHRLPLTAYRQLVELLFCRPGRWQAQKMAGELQAMGLALKALIKQLNPGKSHPASHYQTVSKSVLLNSPTLKTQFRSELDC